MRGVLSSGAVKMLEEKLGKIKQICIIAELVQSTTSFLYHNGLLLLLILLFTITLLF
jgi:hypothetical protein